MLQWPRSHLLPGGEIWNSNLKFMQILGRETVAKVNPRGDMSLHLLIMQAQRILPFISTSPIKCTPLYPPSTIPSNYSPESSLGYFHGCWDMMDYCTPLGYEVRNATHIARIGGFVYCTPSNNPTEHVHCCAHAFTCWELKTLARDFGEILAYSM